MTERRTRTECTEQLRSLIEDRYPNVAYVRLVVNTLNTHMPAARYATFPPARARAIPQRLALQYTPNHGSWLNMAEMESSVFARGCLARPVGDLSTGRYRVAALDAERNGAQATIDWQFTSPVARTQLAKL